MSVFGHPCTIPDLKQEVLRALNARQEANRKLKWRRCCPLTKAGKAALEKMEVSYDFVKGFQARHQHLFLAETSDFDTRRMQWSTMGVLRKHCKDLKAWLIKHKVLDSNGRPIEGQQRRLGNCDECPSPLSSGSNSGSRVAFGTKGRAHKKAASERSENITINPLMLWTGEHLFTQIILKSAAKDKQGKINVDLEVMAKAKAFWCYAEKSVQDTETFVEFLERLALYLDAAGIPHTAELMFCLLVDGHITRVTLLSLRKAKALFIAVYILPPHATTIYQPLDKLYASYHSKYGAKLTAWQKNTQSAQSKSLPTPTKNQAFNFIMELIAEGWFSQVDGEKAFKHCGIGPDGVDEGLIDKTQLIPDEESVADADREFLFGRGRADEPAERVPTLETELQYYKRISIFWKDMALEEGARVPTLRDLGVFFLPSQPQEVEDDAGKEKKKGFPTWGCTSTMQALEQCEAKEAALVKAQRSTPRSMRRSQSGSCCVYLVRVK